jgi:hypothetical protein
MTSTISLNGGTERFTSSGMVAVLEYANNDAAPGTELAIRGSFGPNGVPRPPTGNVAIALQLEVSGTHVVTFSDVASRAGAASPLLDSRVDYSVFMYAGGQPVGLPYEIGPAMRNRVNFLSPLADLSLTPGIPLIIEIVGGARLPVAPPLTESSRLQQSGSTIALPVSGVSGGSIEYGPNDAPRDATLTFVNSGATNLTNAPVPPGIKPALFLQMWVSGIRFVAFTAPSQVALGSRAAAPTVQIRSPLLAPGVAYRAYFVRRGQVANIGQGIATVDGTVSLRSPFVGVSSLHACRW